jgi:hypothetical protein
MTSSSGERTPEAESRVQVRTRVVRRSDAVRVATGPLRHALQEVEHRFIAVQSSRVPSASTKVLADYVRLLSELATTHRQLGEAVGRRDISYLTDRRLNLLEDYCHWLSRRVSSEFLLVLQVLLEQEMRRAMSPAAYQIFLRFEEIEDTVNEIETLPDKEFMNRLNDGVLLQELVELARAGEISGDTHDYGPGPQGVTGLPG